MASIAHLSINFTAAGSLRGELRRVHRLVGELDEWVRLHYGDWGRYAQAHNEAVLMAEIETARWNGLVRPIKERGGSDGETEGNVTSAESGQAE